MSYTALTEKEVVGRKDYDCVWCPEIIPKGTKHTYRAYVFDGFQTDRMHLECFEASVSLEADIEDGFYAHEFRRGTCEEATFEDWEKRKDWLAAADPTGGAAPCDPYRASRQMERMIGYRGDPERNIP